MQEFLKRFGDKADTAVNASSDVGTLVSVMKGVIKKLESLTVTVGEIEVKNDAGSPIPVSQAAHDSLNANANMQVGNADVSASNAVPIQIISQAALIEGNVTLTGVAQNLASNACKNVTVQAEPTNAGYVYVGRSSSVTSAVHMATLSPGSSYTFNVTNSNLLFVIGTLGDKISFGGEV